MVPKDERRITQAYQFSKATAVLSVNGGSLARVRNLSLQSLSTSMLWKVAIATRPDYDRPTMD